jgi:ribosomal protein S11
MICPEKLEYKSVTDAMLAGNFYASMGPEIKELYVEDGVVHIETSSVESIIMLCDIRRWGSVHREKGKRLTRAEFKLPTDATYVRFEVIGKDGKKAATNAYFIEDILSE